MGDRIYSALNYVLQTKLIYSLPLGRFDIDGSHLYALVQEYPTKPIEQGKWEAHRKYIDIQYMVSGKERMGFANINTLQQGIYSAEKDLLQMEGTGNFVDVFAGAFVIFFPEDGHMPGLNAGVPEIIKKVVLKVKIPESF